MRHLAVVTLLIGLAGCQAPPDPAALYWKSWSDNQLDAWLTSSNLLFEETSRYCTDSSSLGQTQERWEDTFLRWSSINGFPYKGVADLTLEFELYFWPDRRNRVEGQLRRRLTGDEQATPELLESRIAAEKGLAAIEWLLFSADTNQSSRCNLLLGTVEDYHNKVTAVADYHNDNPVIADAWLTSEGVAQSKSISLNLLFAQITALESRLSNSLSEDFVWLEREAYGWRSSMTLESFSASLGSLLDHLKNLSSRPELSQDTQSALFQLISQGDGLHELMAAGESPAESLMQWLAEVENLLQNNISRDFDVLIGFNNFDGD